jgi:hypothetical protein
MVPGTKKPALKPQLAALLAKGRVEIQKLRSSEFKPPPKPHVASQKAQKAAKATGELVQGLIRNMCTGVPRS